MGRRMRFDWKGCLHHVMARGIDGRSVFSSLNDKIDLTARLSALITETNFKVYAWAIMPNHIHLLLRTADIPVSHLMHRLLTGYAVCYNKRNDRTGYVFQSRFKSILVQEESYFLELVRYIHLNPLKAGIVDGFESLEHYGWCGHGSVTGHHKIQWHDRSYVLSRFGINSKDQIKKYLGFIKDKSANKETDLFISGNFILGKHGITTPANSNNCNSWVNNCRILGTKEFALKVMMKLKSNGQWPVRDREDIHDNISRILLFVQDTWGISLNQMRGSARNTAISDARALVAWICSYHLGLSNTDNASLLGLSRTGIAKAIKRGAEFYSHSSFIRDNLLLQVSQVKYGPSEGG
jgi:putative transposase